MKLSFSPIVLFLALGNLSLVSGCQMSGSCDKHNDCCTGYCERGDHWQSSCKQDPSTPDSWHVITEDDFETDEGNFNTGRKGAKLVQAGDDEDNQVPDGSGALRIRKTAHVTLTPAQDVTAYMRLRVSFKYRAIGMERGEGFALQYSWNGGESWKTIEQFKRGRDFSKAGNVKEAEVDFTVAYSGNYGLTDSAKIRFVCEGSDNSDRVYIDNVVFEGGTV